MFNVLRKGAMGDVLLLEPVLSALMAQHGQVNLLTRAVQLATRIPNLKVNQKFNTLHLNLDDSYEKDTHKLISQAYFEASGLPYLERKHRRSFCIWPEYLRLGRLSSISKSKRPSLLHDKL